MSNLRTQQTEDGVTVCHFNDAKILDEARIALIGSDLVALVTEISTPPLPTGPDGESKPPRLLLNFEGVTFMSSHMIGKLVLLNKKCKTAKVALKFCNISPNVNEVFKIMRLNKVFDIQKDEEKALKSFAGKKGWFS